MDERGEIVDGDQLIGIIALDRLARDALPQGIVVASVLSNGGLEKALSGGGRQAGADAGGRQVHRRWDDASWTPALGGEKSGHVIIRDRANAGDGLLTALEILAIMARSGTRLSELAAQIPLYPQQQRTIHVRHKDQWEADPTFAQCGGGGARGRSNGSGRILVRPSGTEPALRIMVEGEDEMQCCGSLIQLAALARERLN